MTTAPEVTPQHPPASAMLGFASGDQCWLVDLADAGEVLPVPPLSAVPLTRPWFRGIANVRGTFYSVSDLAAFHGDSATAVTPQARLLLAGAGLRRRSSDASGKAAITNMALLMSRTFGIKSMDGMQEDAIAPAPHRPWAGACYRDAEGKRWQCLHLQALMSATAFLDIAA